jgi:SAM-dependent methyltransferase
MASLYDRYDLYDLVSPPDAAMEAFYVGAARANGPRVLELACGSGRFAVPLAVAGLEVVGCDLAEPMLVRARDYAAERGVKIETILADVRELDLKGRQFDTVFIAANSIMHLLTTADFRGFFRSVARHLAPGGQLVFDCFVPSVALLCRPGQRQHMADVSHPMLGEIAIEEIIDYDALSQISHTRWFWSTRAERDFLETPLELRQIFPQELPLLVASHGFALTDRFGDFDRGPFVAGSCRQVCICDRAP